MNDYRECTTSKIYLGKYSDLYKIIYGIEPIFLIDSNVFNLYEDYFIDEKYITIPSGEESKQLSSIEEIYVELLYAGANRNSYIVGVGGGVTLDIAGFVASTFMRGIRFGYVPTTLLAMADASIGGKNGVNIEEYKNIIGTFNPPEFILIDPKFVETLLNKEIRSGYAEVIKHALIRKNKLFDFLRTNSERLLAKQPELTYDIIRTASQVKIDIVNQDEKESDLRKILNFGHTLGHAIERIKDISHGEAVAIGMVFASNVSHHFGLIDEKYLCEIIQLIDLFKLPTKIDIDKNMIADIMMKDKKRNKDTVDFVLLKGRGNTEIRSLTKSDLEELIGKFL